MSLYFQFECAVCELQGGALNQYAGNRWDMALIESAKFFIHHIQECDPTGFRIRCDSDDDGEYLTRLDAEFIPATRGVFPHSDDWDLVAEAADVRDLDEAWSERRQRLIEEDIAEQEGE